jgi:hypothetical protein
MPAPTARSLNDLRLTVEVHGVAHDLDVPRLGLGAGRAEAVRATIDALVPAASTAALVVERTGTPIWGAAAGGDLVDGDRLVEAQHRRVPLLLGISGPLAGVVHPISAGAALHRGAAVGGRVVEDPEASRTHATVDVRPETTRLLDLGSRNGTFCNGVRVDGSVVLRAGDVVDVGASRLVYVADEPPTPGRLVERGRVFVRPERLARDTAWLDLAAVVAAAVARRPPLWGLVPGHPHHLALPVAPASAGPPATAPPWTVLGPSHVIGIVGNRAEVEPVLAAWLARLTVLQGPARFRLRVDAAPDGLLWNLRRVAEWLPHNVLHPPARPAWEHLATLHLAEPGAAPLARGRRGDLRIWAATTPRALPVGTDVVLDLRSGPAGVETMAVPVLEVVARWLAPVSPTVPAEPFPADEDDASPEGDAIGPA